MCGWGEYLHFLSNRAPAVGVSFKLK